MEKHLLVAVSDQVNAMYGPRFLNHFFTNKNDIKLTLFYIAPKPLNNWKEKDNHDYMRQSKKLASKYEARGRKAIEVVKKDLIEYGFKPDQVNTKIHVREISKVMDIVTEAEKGHNDAVVLGRRGLSWLAEAFDHSISRGVLEKRVSFPLWLCRRPDSERKNVLLCLDGSDSAYRMADHIGFILRQEKRHEVMLFVVKSVGVTMKESPENIFHGAREHLVKNGFPTELIKTKMLDSGNVSKAILKKAGGGQFAVVALGRTGVTEGHKRRLFMGSVSETLFRELEGAALWICH